MGATGTAPILSLADIQVWVAWAVALALLALLWLAWEVRRRG